ncbi:MAG: MBL fold metallo-hydrolase [Bacteroidetes bacterium]|nr:MAG: MBL fold metallo-hydrolase [Bacteroidota bacterium]
MDAPCTFTFIGTGTSQGVPVIACPCPVCQSTNPLDHRLRSSGWLRSAQTSLVFDTGPDFRQQMLRARVQTLDAVVFTHSHKDHVAGLDDVRAFNFLQRRDMPIYGTSETLAHLRREFYYIFEHASYPGVPRLELHEIDPDKPFRVGEYELTPIPVWHGKMPVLGFRIGDFAYITDAKVIPAASRERLKGVKVLVLNALRQESHHSHLTLAEALDLAQELGVEQAWFTHISHLMGLHAEVQAGLPPGMNLAYDGLSLSLSG